MSSISKLELISQIKINLLLNLSENQEKKVFDPHGCKSTSAGTGEWGEGCLAIAFACLPGIPQELWAFQKSAGAASNTTCTGLIRSI